MRKSVHFRMLLGAGGFAANPDGPLAVEFCKRTLILGSTLLANDQIIPANGATIIGVSNFVGGVASLTGGAPDVHWDDDGANALTPASFDYTLQDNVTSQTSTATVTLQPFFPLTVCVDDGPGGAFVATEFRPLILPKFGAGSITANDTFGGAISPPPNTANPVTVTVLSPVNCTVIDLGATIQVTSTIAFQPPGPGPNECSFSYFLTDTKTGQISNTCEVKVTIIANFINAVNDSGIGVTELINNNISINGVILANDTFVGTPVFAVVGGSAVNCTAVVVGANVRVVPVARLSSTTCSFQYKITDPLMPLILEPFSNRRSDTATVSMNINLPTPVANNDTGPSVIEDLGQSPPSVVVSKATLLLNDNCGSQPCTFSTSGLVALNNCVIVSTAGGNVTVRAAGPVANGNCTWRYRVTNAQGAFSGFATVTHTVLSVPFVVMVDTGHHAGGFGTAASLQGNLVVPGGASLMKTEVWGAAGGDGGQGGFAGRGAIRRCVSNVTPGDVIDFACGERGTNGNAGGIFGGTNGLGGNILGSASSGGNPMNGFHNTISGCPQVDTDGGTAVGGFNKPSGGGGTSGDNFGCPGPSCQGGGGGGGAGSVVWFSGIVTNNIISVAGGGGGAGATATGSNGTSTFAQACRAHGRTMTTPDVFARRAHGGGGGGFRGGDESDNIGPNNGGPGGGSSGNTGRFISGTQVVTVEPTRTFGRVIISFA